MGMGGTIFTVRSVKLIYSRIVLSEGERERARVEGQRRGFTSRRRGRSRSRPPSRCRPGTPTRPFARDRATLHRPLSGAFFPGDLHAVAGRVLRARHRGGPRSAPAAGPLDRDDDAVGRDCAPFAAAFLTVPAPVDLSSSLASSSAYFARSVVRSSIRFCRSATFASYCFASASLPAARAAAANRCCASRRPDSASSGRSRSRRGSARCAATRATARRCRRPRSAPRRWPRPRPRRAAAP